MYMYVFESVSASYADTYGRSLECVRKGGLRFDSLLDLCQNVRISHQEIFFLLDVDWGTTVSGDHDLVAGLDTWLD